MLDDDSPLLFSLIPRARAFRKNPTPSEALLWASLRRNRLGVHFRRQHVIGCFIVDFACLTRRLIVEVDGGIHRKPDVARYDALRQESLERWGYRVVRVEADVVEHDLPAALAVIRAALRR